MIDDDLDKLLTDVDGNSEFSSARSQELRSSEKIVRKSDKNLGDDYAGNNSVRYAELLRKYRSDPNILQFKKGYINVFKRFYEINEIIKSELNSTLHSEELMRSINKYKYDLIKYLENVDKYYNDFLTTQSNTAIVRKVKQEFTLFFKTENVTQQRIDFLVLKEMFLRLREYNSFIRKEYKDFDSRINVINLIADGKTLYNKLKDISDEALSYCNDIDKFINYIALVLSISEDDIDVLEKDMNNRIYFRSSMDYSYNSLFESHEDFKNEEKEEFENVHPPEHNLEREKTVKKQTVKIVNNSKYRIDFKFNPPGLRSWNTKEPYIIKIENDPQIDIDNLKATVFFIKNSEEASNINASIKKAMLRSYTDPVGDIVSAYESFIYKLIIGITQDISKKFNIDDDTLKLLIFHVGPGTYFNAIKNYIHITKVGICFKMLSDNKLSRYIPDTFIKTKILNWFEENINSLKLQFDSIEDYNKIKEIVKKTYKEQLINNMEKINQAANVFYEKTGKHIDKNAMLKKKSNDLFGIYIIPVYRRFVDKLPF